jgi:hypothetical protein
MALHAILGSYRLSKSQEDWKMATGTRELNVNGQLIGDSRRGQRLDLPRLVTIGVALVIVVRRAVDELARQLSGEYERLAELEAGRLALG